MNKLEIAGFINIEKTSVNKKPITRLELTPEGRLAFSEYRERLKLLFADPK